ncbi:MAG: winged helix-turn-helix domain-containing protein [Planctomycetota bacterium]|jgi:DNA-binding transcriptional ArsR family regulator|nr:winged helix-turn-helix domain-containing protein [Planctomycetota bacterium]
MFSRWNLSRNPFDTNPISLGTLDWFTGRKREVEFCRRLLVDGSVVLVEGELGVGTTSFGNAVRFSGSFTTPRMELGVFRGWHSQTLLENVLVAVLRELQEDPKARKSAVVRRVKPIAANVERAVHGAGVSFLGIGGQISRNVATTQPGIIPMETLRQSLLDLAQVIRPEGSGASFVVQLNNLDPELTFTETELVTFLNDIRDSLQLPGFSWLVVGKAGLSQFVTRKVPRLRSIITHDVVLRPLTLDGVHQAIRKRLKACSIPGLKPKNPIHAELLGDVYEVSAGSLREVFMICSKLCLAVAADPLYDLITRDQASAILAELLAVRFERVSSAPLQRSILKELSKEPGLTQTALLERLDKSQTAVSRAARILIDADLLRRRKDGREVQYWPAPEVRLASREL